jgi:hypothetical protein
MRYFLDTEFLEYGQCGNGRIDLISIGICAADGREYYAENAMFNWPATKNLNPWLVDNVLPHLDTRPTMGVREAGGAPYITYNAKTYKHPGTIRDDILEFTRCLPSDRQSADFEVPEFWGYYSDYDWVVFCWLFGLMVDLPEGFPMYCLDIKQMMHLLGIDRTYLPPVRGDEHNALNDARWNREVAGGLLLMYEAGDLPDNWKAGRADNWKDWT